MLDNINVCDSLRSVFRSVNKNTLPYSYVVKMLHSYRVVLFTCI
nr:MAG TPA: hypothetical protein [Caudoviricetes sp.]